MGVNEKYAGITHAALTVSSLGVTKFLMKDNQTEVTGLCSFGGMSAIFIRDPGWNVIELDAYGTNEKQDMGAYSGHV